MQDEINKVVSTKKNMFPAVICLECILAVLLIAGAFFLKYLLPKEYERASDWYKENIMTDTAVSEIIEEATDEN